MRTRRLRQNEDESSLELLLDTMCNTFGGVMFIAISLFVVISAVRTATPERPEAVRTEKIQAEIAFLENAVREAAQKLQNRRNELAVRQETTLSKQQEELALLEKLEQEEKLRENLAEIALQTLLAEQHRRHSDLNRLHQQELRLTADAAALRKKQAELEEAIAKLTETPELRRRLQFHILQSDSRPPFYLLLRGDRLWPVGPWIKDDADVPDAAVNSRETSDGKIRSIHCVPKPETGIAPFAAQELSAECRQMLGRIPPDRVPLLVIAPGAARTGWRLRELLKRECIVHGCILQSSDDQEFVYFYTEQAIYEY